jgi:hypothetical protein
MREKIDLGKPQILPSGKVRWRKSHNGNPWISPSYDIDSRRNMADAWALFVVFRDEIDAQEANKQEENPLRKELVEKLQDEITLAQINQDSSKEKRDLVKLKLVRTTDESNLPEIKELLFGISSLTNDFPDVDINTIKLMNSAANNVQQNVISNKRKRVVKTDELIEEWLRFRRVDNKAGDLSAGGFANIRRQVNKFGLFCPNILEANALRFAQYKAQLQLSDMSRTAQRDDLTTAKAFLEWCSDTAEVIEPIKGLRKRGSGIKISKKKKIIIWDDEDVFDLLKTVKAEQKLYCLLILNTGAYESDIGTWKKFAIDDEGKRFQTFDKQARTIRFKRHKEKDVEGVPTVTYRLWNETYNLLCNHESKHETLLLTTSKNTRLWRRDLDEETGMLKAKGMIGKDYRKLRAKLNKDNWGTLEDLRKTAISKLHESDRFARYGQYFAGHAPTDTINTFYVKPNQEKFDEAVIWLGEQFVLS